MDHHFPDELLLRIIPHLPGRDLKTVRLANKRLSSIATPLLYPRVFLSSHAIDVEVFSLVMNNPLIYKNIKTIVWDDTSLCTSLMDKEKYFRTACAVAGASETLEDENSRTEGYEVFLQLSRLHHQIRRSRRDEQILHAAMPLLTGLESVVLTNRHLDPVPMDEDEVGTSPSARQWQALPLQSHSGMPFRPHVDWTWQDLWSVQTRAEPQTLAELRHPDFYEDQPEQGRSQDFDTRVMRPFRGWTILMSSLAQAQRPIRSLAIRPDYRRGVDAWFGKGIPTWYFREWSTELDNTVAVFQGLRRLHLAINSESTVQAYVTLSRGHLRRVLHSAQLLEELSVEVCSTGFRIMQALVPGPPYPGLRSFSLRYGDVDLAQLFDFLRAHEATMQSLSLQRCSAREGEWRGLFEKMRTHRMCFSKMKLRRLRDFSGPGRTSTSTRSLKDTREFLLRDGPYPFVSDNASSR